MANNNLRLDLHLPCTKDTQPPLPSSLPAETLLEEKARGVGGHEGISTREKRGERKESRKLM
jgi:hypothetical protein